MSEKVKSSKDLVKYIDNLALDFEENPDSLENSTIPGFLKSMSAWLSDSGVVLDKKTAKLAAELLSAGKIYE